jgi:O-antigen ligase
MRKNFSLKLVNVAIVLFVFGTVIPAITLSDYINIPAERYVFKGLGVILLSLSVGLATVLGRCKLRRSELVFLVTVLALPFVFSISASIYDFSGSLVQWLRFIAVLLIIIFLSALNEQELLRTLKIYCYIACVLALISFCQYLVGYPSYEKFPVLNIRSNKSIIFEQNVYGLFIYMSFLIHSLISTDRGKWRKWGAKLIYLFGIFISFYRTVYAFILLRMFVKHVWISLAAATGILYFSGIGVILIEALKLEQISNLTGRSTLWGIALDSFYNAPLIGLGENAIPDVSNAILNRTPPYTTYHNVLFDVLAISGVVGFVIFSFLFVYIFVRLERGHRLVYLMLMAPALLNTYIAFMPNPLGGILGVFVFYSINVRRNRLITRGNIVAY